MNAEQNEGFDNLTRAFGTSVSRRQMLKLIFSLTIAWFGGTITLGSGRAQSNCIVIVSVNSDGNCFEGENKIPIPGNVPTGNGCGPDPASGCPAGPFKIPQGYGDANFTPGCNDHDTCYEDCNYSSHAYCDSKFGNDLLDICAVSYPDINTLPRFGCYELATDFEIAVRVGGDCAWIAAQHKACECCIVGLPTPIPIAPSRRGSQTPTPSASNLLPSVGFSGREPDKVSPVASYRLFLPLVVKSQQLVTWNGIAEYNGQTIGIQYLLDDSGGNLSGRQLLRDPKTGEFLEAGQVSGSRTGGIATWTTEANTTIQGVFTESSFTGTLTFPARNNEAGLTANLSLTRV
jgi:hypothetical protein